MCIIISKPINKEIPQKHLENSYSNNKDGVGIMFAEKGSVKIEKWLGSDHEKFLKRLKELKNKNVVVHYRAASVGGISLENVHPFWVFENKMAMCHNGTIYKAKSLAKNGESDTVAFARMLSDLPNDFLGRHGLVLMMKEYIGTNSRIAFLDENGTVAILNKQLGKEIDGIWYSNDYFEKIYPNRGGRVEFSGTSSSSKSLSRKINTTIDKYGGIFDFDRNSSSGTIPLRYKSIDLALADKTKGNVVQVFVYGTLKQGYGNNRRLGKDAKLIGTAVTTTQYPMLDGGFPYLLDKPSMGEFIKGELWEIPVKQLLSEVDSLEGYPSHYLRRVIEVVTTSGAYKAVTYFKANVSANDLKKPFISEWVGYKAPSNKVSEEPYLNDKLDDIYSDYDEIFDHTEYRCNDCNYTAMGSEFIDEGCCPNCMSSDIDLNVF